MRPGALVPAALVDDAVAVVVEAIPGGIVDTGVVERGPVGQRDFDTSGWAGRGHTSEEVDHEELLRVAPPAPSGRRRTHGGVIVAIAGRDAVPVAIGIGAGGRGHPHTQASAVALVAGGAGVAVVAHRPRRGGRRGAQAIRRITLTDEMARVRGQTRHHDPIHTLPGHTRFVAVAGIAVGAVAVGDTGRSRRGGAHPRRRSTHTVDDSTVAVLRGGASGLGHVRAQGRGRIVIPAHNDHAPHRKHSHAARITRGAIRPVRTVEPVSSRRAIGSVRAVAAIDAVGTRGPIDPIGSVHSRRAIRAVTPLCHGAVRAGQGEIPDAIAGDGTVGLLLAAFASHGNREAPTGTAGDGPAELRGTRIAVVAGDGRVVAHAVGARVVGAGIAVVARQGRANAGAHPVAHVGLGATVAVVAGDAGVPVHVDTRVDPRGG